MEATIDKPELHSQLLPSKLSVSELPVRISELDGLRALAILSVIGCHYQAFATSLNGLLKFGWVGVDVFFVLSGYLITSILLKMRNTQGAIGRFYGRRFRRILPPVAIALVMISIACVLTDDRSFFSKSSLVKNGLFLQSFGNGKAVIAGLLRHQFTSLSPTHLPEAADGITGPLSASTGILWSLSIEEYFYLLWAPVVLWFSRRFVAFVAFSICVFEFFVRWMCFSGRPDYFSIFYRFDALIYGAIVALSMDWILRHRRLAQPLIVTFFTAATGALALILFQLRPIMGMEIRQSALFMVVGMPLISMIVGSLIGYLVIRTGSGDPVSRLLRSWTMRSVGTISYTLYLVHVFFYLLFVRFLGLGFVASFTALSVSMLFAACSWRFIEKPILVGKP